MIAREQEIQAAQYELPYHYIPLRTARGFRSSVHWSWSARYLAGLELVLRTLEDLEFASLLDVGCGDGRFIREAVRRFAGAEAHGVDYDSGAIALARAMNPALNFECRDIATQALPRRYDAVTMVEVLEHIPPQGVPQFLAGVSAALEDEGRLVLTVPHANKRLNEKHFQHFTAEHLRATLADHFEVESVHPFDRQSRVDRVLERLLGGTGAHFVVTNERLNAAYFERCLRVCLEAQPEARCGRLLAVARKR